MIDAAAELERDVWPADFLIEERGKPALIDSGRQRLLSHRVECAVREPATGASVQPADGSMGAQHLHFLLVVGEGSTNHVAVELVVLVAANRECCAIGVDCT